MVHKTKLLLRQQEMQKAHSESLSCPTNATEEAFAATGFYPIEKYMTHLSKLEERLAAIKSTKSGNKRDYIAYLLNL